MTFFKGAVPLARAVLSACMVLAALTPVMAQDTTIRTIAGNGTRGHGGDGGPATGARIDNAYDTVHDSRGNLLIADFGNHRIRRVNGTTGVITTIAGTGTPGYNGDGIPATAATLVSPVGVGVDAKDNIYITEYFGGRVRRIDAASGLITTIAGTGGVAGDSGNGGPATAATFGDIRGIAVDAAGNVFIASPQARQIRRIDAATGRIDAFASGFAAWNIDLDAAGNLYAIDINLGRVLRIAASNGSATLVAGGGGSNGESVPATSATITTSFGVAVDAGGNVWIAETDRHRIRRVDAASGLIRTVAGTGAPGYAGDGGPAISALFNRIHDVEVDATGQAMVVADSLNYRVRGFGAFPTSTAAQLVVSTVAAGPQAYAGAMLGYGVDVQNLGPNAAAFPGAGFALDAEVVDLAVAAPAGWNCDTPTTGGGTSSVSCMAAQLADATTARFTITGTAPAAAVGRTVVLTAAATSQTHDPDTSNNSDSDGTAVLASADLAVTLAGPATLATLTPRIYTTRVRNLGALPATRPSVLIHAGLPSRNASLRTPAGWTCVRQPTRTFRALCDAEGSIAVGATVPFEATISGLGKAVPPMFEIEATAQSGVADPDTANNRARMVVKVGQSR